MVVAKGDALDPQPLGWVALFRLWLVALDREGLDLDTDGETDPVTGTTTLQVTVDEGACGTAAPLTADVITIAATGMTTGFGQVSWADPGADGSCPATIDGTDDSVTLPASTTNPTVKGTVTVCFRITDSYTWAKSPFPRGAEPRSPFSTGFAPRVNGAGLHDRPLSGVPPDVLPLRARRGVAGGSPRTPLVSGKGSRRRFGAFKPWSRTAATHSP